jgi:hypothetical protein
MLKILNHFKALNRKRLSERRNAKFQGVLSNKFDRESLRFETLKPLIANTSTYDTHGMRNKKFAIYSTFFGASKAKTFNRMTIDSNFDHFFISNNQNVLKIATSMGWKPIYFDLPVSTNRILSAQQSKIPKALPHLFPALKHYDALLYIDDKLAFNASKMYQLSKALVENNQSVMIREHPSLTRNVLNELAVAMIQPRYQAQRDQIVAYIDDQIQTGLKLRVDHLFWTSAIIRNTKHVETNLINEDWYSAILDCGIECQIAFDFIAQRYKRIALMPQDIT